MGKRKEMTRRQALEALYDMAIRLSKHYSYDECNKMWSLCLDWNRTHEDQEIFMCDDEDEEGRYRYFIEDDYFYYAE
jgi:hypothetical protein